MTASMLTHQCQWGNCAGCPEPMRCEHSCHRPYAAGPSWRERVASRVRRWSL